MKEKSLDLAALLFWLTLSLPLLALFLVDSWTYAALSAICLFALGVLIASRSNQPWQELKEALKLPLRRWLGRALGGEAPQSIFTIALLVAVTIALLGWFADGVKEKDYALALGSIFYVPALVLAYDELMRRWLEGLTPTRRHYISWASRPNLPGVKPEDYPALIERYRDREEVLRALRENKLFLGEKEISSPNILPQIAPLAHPGFKETKQFDLLIAEDTDKDPQGRPITNAEGYWQLVETMARALKPGLKFQKICIPASGYDVERLTKELNRHYDRDLKRNSQNLTFNATSGTAAISAATVLVALRGAAEAVYIRQDQEERPLPERLVLIHLNPFKVRELFSDDLPDTEASHE